MDIGTERLLLRRWRDSDRAARAAMVSDPRVMEFYGFTQTREESDAAIDRFEARHEEFGYGVYVVERKDDGAFLGVAVLQDVPEELPFAPAVEIGWMFAVDAWGQGYATEAAYGLCDYAFDYLGLDEVVAFAVESNERSVAVMSRLGMTHDPAEDFDHPNVPAGPLQRHVLYRLRAENYLPKGGL